jgi:hypothetical protein
MKWFKLLQKMQVEVLLILTAVTQAVTLVQTLVTDQNPALQVHL